jgi:hypothetical protein
MVEDQVINFPSYQEMYERFVKTGEDEATADSHAKEVLLLASSVKERFLHWWQTGELRDDLEVKGFRISSFQQKWKYSMVCAFIDFNVLWEDPDNYGMLKAMQRGLSYVFKEKEECEEFMRLVALTREYDWGSSDEEGGK